MKSKKKLSSGKLIMMAIATSALALASLASAQADGDIKTPNTAPSVKAAAMSGKAATMKPLNIVETAAGAGSFKTLVAALQAAGLTETLEGKGPFTVFAPTDEAFAKLPHGTLEQLLKPENKAKLVAILSYHVVPGTIMAADVVKAASFKTVEGQNAAVSVVNGKVMINGARVTKTDILASNGVIHVIDSVLLPQDQ